MVHSMDHCLHDGDGLVDPTSDPGVLLNGNLDILLMDGVVGLCHMVCSADGCPSVNDYFS